MSTVPQPEPLRRAAAMFEGDRASRRLGITITEIVDGAAEGTMTVTDDMLNGPEPVEQVAFGRNGIFDVTVTRGDGTVVALFRGHSRALPVALG